MQSSSIMSHCRVALSSPLSCHGVASSSSSQRWSLSDACPVPNARGQQLQRQRAGMVFPHAVVRVESLHARFATGGMRRQFPWITRQCFGPQSVQKMSSCRSKVVRCQEGGGGSNLTIEDWRKKLPAKRKALYSHSLPCIEAWLSSLGFVQVKEDRALWTIERPDWHAQLSLDVTDLYIRYLKKGPGNLDRDIERKFSYALSREDLENAILGGP